MSRFTLFILIQMLACQFAYAVDDSDKVKQFAETVRELIINSDIEGFSKLPYLPKTHVLSETAKNIIFGLDSNANSFEKIMNNKNLTIKIHGPYTQENHWPNSTYLVFFYDSNNPPFDKIEFISDDIGLKGLYKTFLQMLVTVDKGKVHFHRVPFYIESHHPYVGDYG